MIAAALAPLEAIDAGADPQQVCVGIVKCGAEPQGPSTSPPPEGRVSVHGVPITEWNTNLLLILVCSLGHLLRLLLPCITRSLGLLP